MKSKKTEYSEGVRHA